MENPLSKEYHAILNSFNSSNKSLSESISSISNLLSKLEAEMKETESKKQELATKEENIKAREGKVQRREKQVKTREDQVKKQEDNLKEREKKLEDMMVTTAKHREAMTNKIKLNVGGQLFTTSKSTLLRADSFFETMISSGNFYLEDGEYFVDRDPKLFNIVLNYMRDGVLQASQLNPHDLNALKQELNFFGLNPFTPFPFPQLTNSILEWLPGHCFNLIYQDSKPTATNFYEHCAKKGPTLVIVESEQGFVFGGYSPNDWESIECQSFHKDAFIFTLSNPHSIPPTKYNLNANAKVSTQSASALSFGGFSFGGGDVSIFNAYVSFSFPQSFYDSTGKGALTFTGETGNIVKQLLVYQVKPY